MGYTASGKFDQFLPQTPYAAVLRCLRSLFQDFFFNPHTSPVIQSQHAQQLIDLVGPNKEIICAVIPELSKLLITPADSELPCTSPPPQVSVGLSLLDTRTRFHSIFLGILAMITADSMVTLFIDDVQVCLRTHFFC